MVVRALLYVGESTIVTVLSDCVCGTSWKEITCCITGSICQLSALDVSVSLSLRCVNGQSHAHVVHDQ